MEARFSTNTYYLVRHGEAGNNVQDVLSADHRGQYTLTPRGVEQVEQLAAFLDAKPIDFIVASPVLRTRQTALILSERLKLPLSLDERLCEARFGVFEGEKIETFFDFIQAHGGRLAGEPALGIEGYMDIRERVRSFLADLNQAFQSKHVLIVSHQDILQEFYAELLGEPVGAEQGMDGWSPRKGSACIIQEGRKPEIFVPAVE